MIFNNSYKIYLYIFFFCYSKHKVYNDLGISVLNNALKGYNTSIITYGQTGSGKSYSLFGNNANKGIVPQLVENLFQKVNNNNCEISISICEVYSEACRDLLNSSSASFDNKKIGIYEDPKTGLYGKYFYIFKETLFYSLY